jgi:hypothetical protein
MTDDANTRTHPRSVPTRLGMAGFCPLTLTLAALVLIGIASSQSDDGTLVPGFGWLVAAGFAMLAAVGWSIVAGMLALVALARPNRNPFGRSRNDSGDAIAILTANAANLLLWILVSLSPAF